MHYKSTIIVKTEPGGSYQTQHATLMKVPGTFQNVYSFKCQSLRLNLKRESPASADMDQKAGKGQGSHYHHGEELSVGSEAPDVVTL